MTTAFDVFAVGPEVLSIEELATAYERGVVRTFGVFDRVRNALSKSFSCTFGTTGAVIEDARCAWTLDVQFSFEEGDVSSMTVYVVPRLDVSNAPMPLGAFVAEVAAAVGGSAFDRQSGARIPASSVTPASS